MWTIFKVFIEFVTILLLFYVLSFWLWGMWDLSSPTRDWTRTACIGTWSLNHWIVREVPAFSISHKPFPAHHCFYLQRGFLYVCLFFLLDIYLLKDKIGKILNENFKNNSPVINYPNITANITLHFFVFSPSLFFMHTHFN